MPDADPFVDLTKAIVSQENCGYCELSRDLVFLVFLLSKSFPSF